MPLSLALYIGDNTGSKYYRCEYLYAVQRTMKTVLQRRGHNKAFSLSYMSAPHREKRQRAFIQRTLSRDMSGMAKKVSLLCD